MVVGSLNRHGGIEHFTRCHVHISVNWSAWRVVTIKLLPVAVLLVANYRLLLAGSHGLHFGA